MGVKLATSLLEGIIPFGGNIDVFSLRGAPA
jgi:hypothetical protein